LPSAATGRNDPLATMIFGQSHVKNAAFEGVYVKNLWENLPITRQFLAVAEIVFIIKSRIWTFRMFWSCLPELIKTAAVDLRNSFVRLAGIASFSKASGSLMNITRG
jgi:hypothetical protein